MELATLLSLYNQYPIYSDILIFHFLSPILLWPFFYLLFNVWSQQTISKNFSVPYYVFGVIGVLLDFYVDIFWGTFLFLQWPNINRLTLSARMDDLILNDTGWKGDFATLIVGKLLEPFDKTGQHTTHGRKF